MTKEELQKILDDHKLWLLDNTKWQRADLSKTDLRDANLSSADLRKATLSGADLIGANLYCANLRDANLRNADLRAANLHGADLRDANLRDADLIGAYLTNTCVFAFTLGAHFGFAHFGDWYGDGSYVKIGCEGHSLEHWLENYEEIGKKNGYTTKQIRDYGLMLNLLKEMNK